MGFEGLTDSNEKETIARHAAEVMRPWHFQAIGDRMARATLTDMRAVAYLLSKEHHEDYEKFVARAHKELDDDISAWVKEETKKNLREIAKNEEIDKVKAKEVGEIFETLFLPVINGIPQKSWGKIKIPTKDEDFEFDTREEIIARAGEWAGDRESTRMALISKYLNFEYEKSIHAPQGRDGRLELVGLIYIKFKLR